MFSTLEEADWTGHERFASEADMYATYRSYYGDRVNSDTKVKILSFTCTPITPKVFKMLS